ncbi:hypothetical protein BY458DRAFT_489622 [Sporodiniella umbellata]|nr:hypothetical protein BY458DRAFT_489622 [Sporodiniella umbellata]
MDFSKNCVCIDEAGFNLHKQRSHGRSLKGTPAKGTVPTEKGIVNIRVKKPESASKKKIAKLGQELSTFGLSKQRIEYTRKQYRGVEFWSKVDTGVRRTPLTTDDCLTDRKCELARKMYWFPQLKNLFALLSFKPTKSRLKNKGATIMDHLKYTGLRFTYRQDTT